MSAGATSRERAGAEVHEAERIRLAVVEVARREGRPESILRFAPDVELPVPFGASSHLWVLVTYASQPIAWTSTRIWPIVCAPSTIPSTPRSRAARRSKWIAALHESRRRELRQERATTDRV
jgi:hypothetical protein